MKEGSGQSAESSLCAPQSPGHSCPSPADVSYWLKGSGGHYPSVDIGEWTPMPGELKRTEIRFNPRGGDIYRQYLAIDWGMGCPEYWVGVGVVLQSCIMGWAWSHALSFIIPLHNSNPHTYFLTCVLVWPIYPHYCLPGFPRRPFFPPTHTPTLQLKSLILNSYFAYDYVYSNLPSKQFSWKVLCLYIHFSFNTYKSIFCISINHTGLI